MKIVLENKDVVLFKQKSKLIDKEAKKYSTDYTCAIGESEGNGVNWKFENISAESFIEKVLDVKSGYLKHDIVMYIYNLLNFNMFQLEEQEASVNVKSDKKGIALEFNGELYTFEQLKQGALKFKDETGVTTL